MSAFSLPKLIFNLVGSERLEKFWLRAIPCKNLKKIIKLKENYEGNERLFTSCWNFTFIVGGSVL